MQQKSLASAVLNGKCPHCREGDLFTHPASKLSKFNKMNSSCPRCGIRLEPEPGFYQGAMYVGYAFTMVIIIVISLILYLAGNPSDAVYIGTVIGIMILLVPLNYRYSRIVYLYAFGGIRYDPNWSR